MSHVYHAAWLLFFSGNSLRDFILSRGKCSVLLGGPPAESTPHGFCTLVEYFEVWLRGIPNGFSQHLFINLHRVRVGRRCLFCAQDYGGTFSESVE